MKYVLGHGRELRETWFKVVYAETYEEVNRNCQLHIFFSSVFLLMNGQGK